MRSRNACTLKWILLPLCLCLIFLALARHHYAYHARERAVLPLVQAASTEFDVPVAMILAVIRTESDFLPDAVSDAGAMGLMQIMPETFRFLYEEKLCEPLSPDRITDPAINVRYGTYYLSYLLERFDHAETALAAYNAGEGRVEEWLEDEKLSRDGVLYTIPFPETAVYVEKVLSAYAHYLEKYPQ